MKGTGKGVPGLD